MCTICTLARPAHVGRPAVPTGDPMALNHSPPPFRPSTDPVTRTTVRQWVLLTRVQERQVLIPMSTLDPAGRLGRTERPAPLTAWRKSRRSMSGNDCVEVAVLDPAGHTIGIRDSKNATGPIIAVPLPHWHALLGYIRQGNDDLTV
ncbi:DUF397 domain-containing protein [Actinomadura welshii]|uniref:DUF397 domain-containing protein n=1 Tax=Actinomadura welshii TaxID=3103817 RepID=UPI0030B864BB